MNALSDILFLSTTDKAFSQTQPPAKTVPTAPLLDYRAQMVVAYRHYLDKNYGLALSAYRQVLAHFPADPTALSGEAWSLYYLGQDKKAAVDFRTLLHANAADLWARKGLSLCEGREAD